MYINEGFLSFIWQQLYFNSPNLYTTKGHSIQIINRGYLNRNSGPDFLEARIRIGKIIWAGDVEIHVNSSHWMRHKHVSDSNYNRVILHVVYENDKEEVLRYDGTFMPTLELKPYIDDQVIFSFHNLVYNQQVIPCSKQIMKISRITIISMVEKALLDRLESKAEIVAKILHDSENDWEKTAYRILMKNFGFKVNQSNMLLLSKFVPYKLVLKVRDDEKKLAALIFGFAGFLEKPIDKYQDELRIEYQYLKHKYNLKTNFFKRYQWKYLRMHPQNFPTIRIAQLIKVLGKITNILSYILNSTSISQVQKDFSIIQSEYWQFHYDFGKKAKRKISGLGTSSINNIIINTFIPILAAYATYTDNYMYMDKAIYLLEKISPENNRIIKIWESLNIKANNASESQGMIELYNNYCFKKRCLNCNIGSGILLESKV